MTQFRPSGVWTALVTPFASDGSFDAATFAKLLEFQLAAGVQGLVPCGTTGESATLSWEEHGAAVALSVRRARGRASVMAGAGSNSTEEAIAGARDAWSRGADAVLLVDCYYNGPSSAELRREYYERVLGAVPEVPVVPYVIPGRTGCALSAADVALLHLTYPERVPALKSATGDLERMRADREAAGPTLAVLSGDDELTLRMMQDTGIGASGVISVMSNIVPGALCDLVSAQSAGNSEKAEHIHQALLPLFQVLTIVSAAERTLPDGRRLPTSDRYRNPVPVKTIMAGLGMLSPTFRAPLGLMSEAAVAVARAALSQVFVAEPSFFAPLELAFGVSVEERLGDDRVWTALSQRE